MPHLIRCSWLVKSNGHVTFLCIIFDSMGFWFRLVSFCGKKRAPPTHWLFWFLYSSTHIYMKCAVGFCEIMAFWSHTHSHILTLTNVNHFFDFRLNFYAKIAELLLLLRFVLLERALEIKHFSIFNLVNEPHQCGLSHWTQTFIRSLFRNKTQFVFYLILFQSDPKYTVTK